MWIKTTKNMLVNIDHVVALVYRANTDTTTCVCSDGSEGPVCSGDAIDSIGQAIERGQKYLEVQDYV